jgi:DNA primase
MRRSVAIYVVYTRNGRVYTTTDPYSARPGDKIRRAR